MNAKIRGQAALVMMALAVAVHLDAKASDDRQAVNSPEVGPRGTIGPDSPLSHAEKAQFEEHSTVEGRSAAAVQAACERAVRGGKENVFLPAGEYVFDKTVSVPGGLTLLGEGSRTLVRTRGMGTHLFHVEGDNVRFTRLRLQGADTTPSTANNTYGISVSGRKNIRIDHCEVTGFSYALNFSNEATAQVDHCSIHHNLRDGLGYGVALYSGAHVLITDNEFRQNRHSLASNGALDWSSPKRVGRYVHKPGVRKTHWEFVHNRVGSNDKSPYELCAVDTHPGMDGTFVVASNLFEDLRHGVGIRDGAGLIRGNVFRNLRTVTKFRSLVGVSISYGKHNNIPVEGCMPRDIRVEDNVFVMDEGAKYEACRVGKAENIIVDGEFVPETEVKRPPPQPLPRLVPMDTRGKLTGKAAGEADRPKDKGRKAQ